MPLDPNDSDDMTRSLDKILHHMEIKYRKLQQNNGELARSLADQREEAQRHYAASISHQRQLQALQEGIDEAVSSKLLEVLAEMSEPLIDRLNGSIEASRQQMEQLQVARSLAVALSSAAECGGTPPNAGNQSEQVTPSIMKSSGKWPSSSRVALEPEGGALQSSPSGSSNRQCRVLPMVMGHVLLQPRLTLPKMDPAALRAVAREWRETARIESGMNMSIIAERELEEHSEVDEPHVSLSDDNNLDEEDDVTLTIESPSVPALNDASLRALPSVRVDLSDCVVPVSQSDGDARRGDATFSRPRGRPRSSRGGDRLSLVRAQVKEIVSAVSFRSSDSFTVSETSTHSDEQPSIVDGDPLEGPSWLYSPNSSVNVPRKINNMSPKGCSGFDNTAITGTMNRVTAHTNSDSDSDSLPGDERSVSRNFVSKPQDKEELHDDDVSVPIICKVTRKVYRKRNGQKKNRQNILVSKSPIKFDAQKDDNPVRSLSPLPTPAENESNSNGTTNRKSVNSSNVALKRKSQSNLSNVLDKKRRLSRRQSSRKSFSQDNTKPCDIRVPVLDSPSATHSDVAVISEQIYEDQSINRSTSPVSPQLTKSPGSRTTQQQTKVRQRSALSINASSPFSNGTTNPQVDSPSTRKRTETKYRFYGTASPASPNVMLRRFEELEKRGRRYNKSRGKSREKASSADASAEVLSINNDSDGNKRTEKSAGKALLEPLLKNSEKSDVSSLSLTSSTSNSLSATTTDVQNCQDQSNKALVVENEENDSFVLSIDDVPTSHGREDDMAVRNVKNDHAKKQDSAMNANNLEKITSKAADHQDTPKVTTSKLSKQNKDSSLPGCSDNTGSDLDSAQTDNEEENTKNKAVDGQDTRKVTTRMLSTKTKKSKQDTDLPLPGCSEKEAGPDLDLQAGHEPDKTCHFNEAMEITFADSSSVPHDSYSCNFVLSKNIPVVESQKISNNESPKENVNSDEHTFEVPKLRGKRRKKMVVVTTDICGKSGDANPRNLKDKTEFDLSQLEATVLSIAPYKSAKLKENRPPQEDREAPPESSVRQSESSTRRLSIVLVDVLKSSDPVESSPAIKLSSLTNDEDLNERKGPSFKDKAPDQESSERNPKSDQRPNRSTNLKSRRAPVQSRALSKRKNRGASVDYNESSEPSLVNSEQQEGANSDAPTTSVSSGNKTVSVDPEDDRPERNITMLNGDSPHNPYDDAIIDLTMSPAPSVLSFSDGENSLSDCEIILPTICEGPKSDDFFEFIDVSKLNVSDSDLSNLNKPQEVIQNGSNKIAGSKQSLKLSNNRIPTADGHASTSVSGKKVLCDLPAKKKKGRPKNICFTKENDTESVTSNLRRHRKESHSEKLCGKNVDAASHSMPPPAATARAEDLRDSDDSTSSILRDAPASCPRDFSAISEINSFVNDILQVEAVSADTSRSDEAPRSDTDEGAHNPDVYQVMDATKSDASAIASLSDGEPLVDAVKNDRDAVTGRNGLLDVGAAEKDTKATTNRTDGPAVAAAMEQDAEAAPKGAACDDESGLGGRAPCHLRRASVKVASYAEPKINRKLRRGDTISTTIYAPNTGRKKKNNATRTASAAKEN